jgi:ribonuclease I
MTAIFKNAEVASSSCGVEVVDCCKTVIEELRICKNGAIFLSKVADLKLHTAAKNCGYGIVDM